MIFYVSELQEEELKQHPTQTLEQTQAVPPKQVKVPNKVSSRQKKMPATKSDDFLWQTQPEGLVTALN